MKRLIYSILTTFIFLFSGNAVAQPVIYTAYAGHGYNGDVDVIDIASMSLITTIQGAGGYRMVLTPDGSKLYSTGGDNLLYISNTQTNTLIQAVDPSTSNVFSSELEAITISPDGSRVYIFDESTESLFVWDTAADTLITAFYYPVLDEPENLVISSDGAFLYLNDNTNVTKIRTDNFQIAGAVFVGNDGHGIAISANDSILFADGSGIEIIRTSDMSMLNSLTGDGYYLLTSEDGSRVYGTDEGNQLSVVDAVNLTLINNITLSIGSARGAITYADGDTILVATSSGLIKLDAQTLTELSTFTGNYQSVVVSPGTIVPVELTSFTASTSYGTVTLNWSTATEINNYGFEVERKIIDNTGKGEWTLIGFKKGYGTTTEPKEYSYVDDVSLISATSLAYRLKQVDFIGRFEYSDEVYLGNGAPAEFALHQNYPNPFNPSTKISWQSPVSSHQTLKIYDILGREVAILVDEFRNAGSYEVTFNAEGFSSGIYFYKLQSGSFVETKKMMLLK